MIAEAMNTEYVMPAETFGKDPPEPHKINAVSAVKGLPTSTLSEAQSMQTSAAVSGKPQDGVVELQLSFGDWLKQKFGHAPQGFPKEHEHLVTGSSVCATDLANSRLSQSTTARPTLPALARDVMSTSISAISPIRNGREVRTASTAGEMASDGAAPVSATHVARRRRVQGLLLWLLSDIGGLCHTQRSATPCNCVSRPRA